MKLYLFALFLFASVSTMANDACIVKSGELTNLTRPEESVGQGKSIDYSAKSDANGLCKRLGYASAVPGSLVSACDQVCTLVIDSEGKEKKQECAGQHFECYVGSITCKNF